MSNLVIFGPGKMGAALTRSMQAVGHQVLAAFGHTDSESARRFEEWTGVTVAPSPIGDERPDTRMDLTQADLVLLTLPDGLLAAAARQLAACADFGKQTIVAHTAGSLDASILQPLAETGVRTVAVHPLQTVADAAEGNLFHGVWFTLDGEESALAEVAGWVQHLGGQPILARGMDRARYHAAAALASNALVALAALTTEVSPLPEGLLPFLPLMQGTLQNLRRQGLPGALTGPVERGDVETIKRHLKALADLPDALAAYTALGRATIRLAEEKHSFSPDVSVELWNLFGGKLE
ncbi:DUF2520 domain-containing protein [Alicyclobacillus herbarius]|uniref:DUF2520 domain-containing protein n=1 Tax=Alicyclobacillus herbarius TaxID=122960 RepID=UPI00041E63AC|nr:DUF2520 domain-containing protein [Alicyclobacillus herbarius]